MQHKKEERKAADAEIARIHQQRREQLDREDAEQQAQEQENPLVLDEPATVPVGGPPMDSRLPQGQSMLQPHDNKKEVIPSDSADEEDTKTVVSQHSHDSLNLNPQEEDALLGNEDDDHEIEETNIIEDNIHEEYSDPGLDD